MMKNIRSVGVLTAILIAAPFGAASAADMALKAPPPAPTPVFNWTGCHLGGDIGGAWIADKDSETISATGARSPFSPYPTNTATAIGIKAGGFLGCDYQFSGRFVAGIEGDAEWADLRGGADYTNTGPLSDNYQTQVTSQGSLRGRLGYASDRALFYVTGGAAWARVAEQDIVGGFVPINETHTSTRPGWTAGGGIDYAFTDRWIGRIEYRYSGFGTFTYSPAVTFLGFTESHKITENALRLGVSYKLN
jgi:outer membrane immunogenic protein